MKHPLFTDLALLNHRVSIDGFPSVLPGNAIGNDHALITGATGFIGGFLLKELLQKNAFVQYTCVVRAASEAAGFKRILANLMQKGTPSELIDTGRIRVVAGDTLRPHFGLEPKVYAALADSVDHVFHFAATMNWVAPFNQDTQANIDALKQMVYFCATARLKKLHYASSMGMWTVLHGASGPIWETEIHEQGNELPGGYFQSKWVNEKVLKLAASAGLPVNVYRIGDVKGHSADGQGDPQNFGNLVMKYFIRNGVAIDSDMPEFNFLPVDYLVRCIVHQALYVTGQTFQFSNPELVSFHDICRAALEEGHPCRLVDMQEWLQLLRRLPDPLGRVLTPVFRKFAVAEQRAAMSFYEIGVNMFRRKHDTTNTETALQGTGITCPGMLQDGILKKYLNHLSQIQPLI